MDGILSPQWDSVLLPFLLTSDESEADNQLRHLLVDVAVPVIKPIVRSSIGRWDLQGRRNHESQDVEDVISETVVRVLDTLRGLRRSSAGPSISNFIHYVTIVAHHACDTYLRFKYPNRTRLARALRYAMNRSRHFATWREPNGRWVCGLAQWHNERGVVRPGWVNQAFMEPDRVIKWENTGDIDELLWATFNGSQAPLVIDDVVSLAAEILKVTDDPVSMADYLRSNHAGLAVEFDDPVDTAAQRLLLEHVWKWIVSLPLKQRISLLLAAKDETKTSIAVLLAEVRVASLEDIGGAVGISIDDFVLLLPKLPLSDAAIGKRLNVSRRKIKSSRLSGRRRLRRQLKSEKDEETRERAPYGI